MRLEHHLVGGYVRYISPHIIIIIIITSIFSSLFFFPLWNDVQLQPKLLDRLEFCRAVF